MLLFFVRHGDPIYDPDSLTPRGKRQAEAVSKRLCRYGLDRIYASSSTRAIQTATPTSEVENKPVEILDWCNESHAWRELTVTLPDGRMTWLFHHDETARFLCSEEIRRMGREWYDHPRFAGTTFKQGLQRIQKESDAFFENLGYRHDLENRCYIPVRPNDERVALFAHQGFGLAFLSCLLDVPYPEMCTRFDFGHTGMTVIEFREQSGVVIPKVLTLGNDSHLYAEGLPTKYQNRIFF